VGHEVNYFFCFTVDDSQTVKVDNVGGKILNWLQKESKIPNELEPHVVKVV